VKMSRQITLIGINARKLQILNLSFLIR